MREIVTTLYTFDELSEDAKKEALNKHRDINVSHDWWDCTIGNLVEDCADVGVLFKKGDVYFSILGRDNHIGVDSNNLSFDWNSTVDLPNKFGAYQNYLGGGMAGAIKSIRIKDNRVCVEENENIDEITDNLHSALEYFENALSSLYKEYEYLVEDEQVEETLISNDYEFDNEGNMA